MKRILALALCLMALCPATRAEIFPLSFGGLTSKRYDMLIRDDGTALTPKYTYCEIYELTPKGTPDAERLYCVSPYDLNIEYSPEKAEEMLYEFVDTPNGIMNAEGRMLTDFGYYTFNYDSGYIEYTEGGNYDTWGAMDSAGNPVLPVEYRSLVSLSDGKWLAIKPDEGAANQEWDEDVTYPVVFIDSDGTIRETGLHTRYSYLESGGDDIAIVFSVEEYGGKYVYVDSSGAPMFGRGFDHAEEFTDGYAVVTDDDLYGLIDETGAFVVPAEYSDIYRTWDGPIVAQNGNTLTLYDKKDLHVQKVLEIPGTRNPDVYMLNNRLMCVESTDGNFIYDTEGKLILQLPKGRNINSYGVPNGATRLIEWLHDSTSTERLIDLDGLAASDDYAGIDEGEWQDGHGQYIMHDCNYNTSPDGYIFIDWDSYRCGMIDENGNTVLPLIYDSLTFLSYDRLYAVKGNLSGMIDSTGKWYYSVSDYEQLVD